MKKQFLLLAGALFTSATLFAQQVSNASFETWSQVTNPDGWATSDTALVAYGLPNPSSSVQNTDSTNYIWGGTSSLLLQTQSVTIPSQSGPPTTLNLAGFASYFNAYSARPDSFFVGMGFVPAGADTAIFSIEFTKQGVALGAYPDTGGYVAVLSQATSGVFGGKIKWYSTEVPDSVYIQFAGSFAQDTTYSLPIGTLGTKLYVDTFTFFAFEPIDTATGIANINKANSIKMFPNPASSVVTVEIPAELDAQNITIVDMAGRAVKTVNNVAGKTAVNVDGLNSGNYLVTFTNAANKSFTGSKTLQVKK